MCIERQRSAGSGWAGSARRRRSVSWTAVWPWTALALLGAYHGVNPGMGWLFAVGRGLQERSRSAVLPALLPLALGHELSIVLVVVAVVFTQAFVPPHTVRLVAALALVA